ncbi:MAG: nuclear transport factor 2 family protein, partial [Nitrososphaerales archaeon]
LLTIDDETARLDLAMRTVKDGLTVRDLANIVGRLRSWFPRHDEVQQEQLEARSTGKLSQDAGTLDGKGEFTNNDEYAAISLLIHKIFEFASDRNYKRYKEIHLFEKGFTMYSAFPPLERLQGKEAVLREYEWFYEIAPRFQFKIQDLKIEALDPAAAMSTFTVLCLHKQNPKQAAMKMVATMVLRKHNKEWFILHEHWTKLDLAKSEREEAPRVLSN